MKINFDQILKDLDDKPMKRNEANGKHVTLGDVAIEGLLSTTKSDMELTGSEKFRRFELALRCKGTSDMTAEDVAKLKERIGDVWSPLVVGRAYQLLEGKI